MNGAARGSSFISINEQHLFPHYFQLPRSWKVKRVSGLRFAFYSACRLRTGLVFFVLLFFPAGGNCREDLGLETRHNLEAGNQKAPGRTRAHSLDGRDLCCSRGAPALAAGIITPG